MEAKLRRKLMKAVKKALRGKDVGSVRVDCLSEYHEMLMDVLRC